MSTNTIQTDALVTLQQLKTWLGLDPTIETTNDDQYKMLISMVSAWLTKSCNRTHFLASNPAMPITEYYSTQGDQWLLLKQYPVQSITSINVNNTGFWTAANFTGLPTTTVLVQGTDYALRVDGPNGESLTGMVFMQNGWWDSGQYSTGATYNMLSPLLTGGKGNLQVTYTPGYMEVPNDLLQGALLCCSMIIQSAQFGVPLHMEHFEEYGYEQFNLTNVGFEKWLGIISPVAAPIIAKYRLVNIMSGFGG